MAAFARAQQAGAQTLEMDVKVTSDGIPVITHDSSLNPDLVRDASGSWVPAGVALNSLTLGEVEQLDVGRLRPGSAYARRFPDQQPIDGTRMPTLEAVLQRFSPDRNLGFNIETKLEPDAPSLSPDPRTFAVLLVNSIRENGVQARATIQSFDWRTLAAVREVAPEIRTVALTEPDTSLLEDGSWTNGLKLGDYQGSVPDLVSAAGVDIWSPDFSTLTTGQVRRAHELGLSVIPYTVNSVGDIASVLALGVDGLISDYPDRALAATGTPAPRWPFLSMLALGLLLLVLAIMSNSRVARRRDTSSVDL